MVIDHPGIDSRLIRKARGRPLEVIADDVVDFGQRGWTPELGRILYTVRDYGCVSIYQHRLTD